MNVAASKENSGDIPTGESGNMKLGSAALFRLLDLPNEILLEIVSFLPDLYFRCSRYETSDGPSKQYFELADLRNARLVCKLLAGIGDLWLTTNLTCLYLDASPKSLRAFEAICDHPQYSKAVREVVYIGSRIAGNLRDRDEYYKEAVDWYMCEMIKAGEFTLHHEDDGAWPNHDKWLSRFSPYVTPEVVQAMDRMHEVYTQRLASQERELASKADLMALTKAFQKMPNITSLSFINSTETGAVGWNVPELWHRGNSWDYKSENTVFRPHKIRRIWSCDNFGECDQCDGESLFSEGSFLCQREFWHGFDTLMEAALHSKNTIRQLRLGHNEVRIPTSFLTPYPAKVHINTGKVFANLKHIHIHFKLGCHGFGVSRLSSQDVNPLVEGLRHCPSLESLALIADRESRFHSPKNDKNDTIDQVLSLHFPKLRKLFLEETIATSKSLWAFCKTHSSTLKALGLDRVFLFRGGTGGHPRKIPNVWRPFLTKLPQILTLEEGSVRIDRDTELRDLYAWEKELGEEYRGPSRKRCSRDECLSSVFSEDGSDRDSDVESGIFDFSDQMVAKKRI
ncbi:hypothetical protein BU16DRAFT_534878 [Lophium mytilinum]|uniref:Uncharacterized protein n=1 Tax=Lophium mytilinum TaxID=390894 RepID=A0A6A6R7B1_9PEZI|nr:hypothetical protein BU16DRAFT_534878 [Lophium mytilinum]